MENASKALLLTGSILIGIILLSLAVYVYNIMTEAEKMKASTLTEEQLIKYNQEFLAYDKSRMYGTDVITVLNKAIDNNERYAKYDDSMLIDVVFVLKDTVKNYTVPFKMDDKGKMVMQKISTNSRYLKDITYNLSSDNKDGYSILDKYDMDEIEKFLETQTERSEYIIENSIKKDNNENITYYEMYYTGFSDFKRKIFKCIDVQRNDVGKICYMKFEEFKIN